MISELIRTESVKMGRYTLKNGEVSKYYFDMKGIISYPSLMKEIGDKMYELIDEGCDLLCGVPMGGLPICSYISTKYEIPMIMIRDVVKEYGTSKQIEGTYKKKNKCVIIEDVITTGGSVNKVIEVLKDKVDIVGVVVILDRQEGYTCSVPVKSVITKTDIVKERMKEIMNKKQSKLCFSADLDYKDKVISILNNIGDKIVICKIHYDFYEDDNKEFKNKLIDLSVEKEFLIMEDRKFVDISYTVEKQYRRYSKWVDLITVMGNINSEVISKLSGVVLVANMSNNKYDYIETTMEIAKKYPERIAGLVTQYRIDLNGIINMTPGISKITSSDGDQCYREPEKVDTDIFIVGRGIYNSKDPRVAVESYINNKDSKKVLWSETIMY
jgi:uridine monophosphate synthetase